MRVSLYLPDGVFEDVLKHLLPPGGWQEQGAFLIARSTWRQDELKLDVIDVVKLAAVDFDAQHSDYLELSGSARIRLIKRAHALSASLIEMHSHPGPWPASFSAADRAGLLETVPHMLWRLAKRPYAAIVVAQSGFDALAWLDADHPPYPLDALLAGSRLLRPTNKSLGGWHDLNG